MFKKITTTFLLLAYTFPVMAMDITGGLGDGGNTEYNPTLGKCENSEYYDNAQNKCSSCITLDYRSKCQWQVPQTINGDYSTAISKCVMGGGHYDTDCKWRATCQAGYRLTSEYGTMQYSKCEKCSLQGAPYYDNPGHYNTYQVSYTNPDNRSCLNGQNYHKPQLSEYHAEPQSAPTIEGENNNIYQCPDISPDKFKDMYDTYDIDNECSKCEGNTIVNTDKTGCDACATGETANNNNSECICNDEQYFLDFSKHKCTFCGDNATAYKEDNSEDTHNTQCQCIDGYYNANGFTTDAQNNYSYNNSKASVAQCVTPPQVVFGHAMLNDPKSDDEITFPPEPTYMSPSNKSLRLPVPNADIFQKVQQRSGYPVLGWYPPLFDETCTSLSPDSSTEIIMVLEKEHIYQALKCIKNENNKDLLTYEQNYFLITPALGPKVVHYLRKYTNDNNTEIVEPCQDTSTNSNYTTTCDPLNGCNLPNDALSHCNAGMLTQGFITYDANAATWEVTDDKGNKMNNTTYHINAPIKYIDKTHSYTTCSATTPENCPHIYLTITYDKCPEDSYCPPNGQPKPCPNGLKGGPGATSQNDCKTVADTHKICDNNNNCIYLPTGLKLLEPQQ